MSERPTIAMLLQQGLFHHRQGQLPLAMERYTQALREEPENAEALYYVAVVACQQGDLETGIDLARRSLSFSPRQPRAHNVLGQALQRRKQFDEALTCYDTALEYDANFVDALANRANLLGETGRHAQAIAAYDKVLALRPGLPQDWCNRGQSQHALGQFADAIASNDRALALEPNFALAHYNRAEALKDAGRLEEALPSYARAAQLFPHVAEFHCNHALALRNLGQADAALDAIDRAVARRADFAEAHAHRGGILVALKRFEDALAAYERAVALKPDLAGAWLGRGNVTYELGRYSDALAAYDRALALKSDFAEAIVGRGNALTALANFSDALTTFERALSLSPDLAEAWLGRGNALASMGRHAVALESFARALSLQPDMPLALYHSGVVQMECAQYAPARASLERAAKLSPDDDEIAYSLSELQLLQGDWAEGFVNFERRSNPRRPAYTPLALPRWDGEPPGDYRLVLLTEQGIGDTIQFSRYAALLAARGYPTTLLAREEMVPLLRGLGGVEVLTAPEQLSRDPRPARWLPLMSVMQRLHLTPDTIPAQPPYLAAEAARAAAWAERLGPKGFKIGITWQGRMEGRRAARAAALGAFASLAEIPGVRLISLQKAPGSAQITDVAFAQRFETPLSDTDFSPDALPDMAALMANLDLVVSIDTMSAHLAGALGRPVFVALRHVPDWRWLLDRDDTPWYPSMRLFRQHREGEWADVFARVAAAAREMMKRTG